MQKFWINLRKSFKIFLWLCAGMLVLTLSMALPFWADLLNLRYGLCLFNPYWLNFQIVSLTAFMLVFLSSLVLSRRVMLSVIPLAVMIIVFTSVSVKNINSLIPWGEDEKLLSCLRNSGSDITKGTQCYEANTVGTLAPLWADYCDKKMEIGSNKKQEAKHFRRAQCRYNKMKMEFSYAD